MKASRDRFAQAIDSRIELAATSGSDGNGVHSSKAIVMVASSRCWIPVDRSGKEAGQAAIREGLGVLGKDELLGIYPEGTRSPDGRLYKFRTGVARVALRSGAPVVPVGLIGTRDVQPPDSKRWHKAAVGVHFGEPMDFSGRAAEERSSRVLREITEQIRKAVQRLSGQEYVDMYASNAKAA